MYLYVARPADENEAETFEPLEVLAEPVRVAFGRATFVMHLELSESRKLARANVLCDGFNFYPWFLPANATRRFD